MNIWDIMYEKFTFKKDTITLFESFAGIGSQHIALKKLSKEFNFKLDVVGISEIDKYAIAAYNAIHGKTKNYGSITDIQEIPQVDIFTYSFPCQDISLAGNQKGFSRDSGTRSGLLWEVERLLENQEKSNKLPKVLLMENVKALVGMKFKDDYIEWQLKLQELGYTNYWEVLNSKNYGIPQNRERVFMVSILGEYSYNFPKPFPLKLRLKDMLEDEVDKKYYLSDKQIEQISKWNAQQDPLKNAKTKDDEVLQCITAKSNTSMNASMLLIKEATKKGYAEATNGDGVYLDQLSRGIMNKEKEISTTLKAQNGHNGVVVKGNYSPSGHNASRIVDEKGIAPTVMENHGTVTAVQIQPKDRNYNKKGIEREEHLETRKDKISNAILTNDKKNMIIFEDPLERKGWHRKAKEVLNTNGITTCITAQSNNLLQKIKEQETLRIRKLTPKECYRLMGFDDLDYDKAANLVSNTQLYKQAGNSIVVDVLYYIFKELF